MANTSNGFNRWLWIGGALVVGYLIARWTQQKTQGVAGTTSQAQGVAGTTPQALTTTPQVILGETSGVAGETSQALTTTPQVILGETSGVAGETSQALTTTPQVIQGQVQLPPPPSTPEGLSELTELIKEIYVPPEQ
jgi:hypothetical protein